MLYSGFCTYSDNLGDEIQNIAAANFLPRVDYVVDREDMAGAAGQPPSFLIANGWYLHCERRFPPPPNIHPFYISVHIHRSSFLTPEALAHFRIHEPIGCRDIHTLELLRAHGIAAYYSGCLTLTLMNRSSQRTEQIYLVDVPEELRRAIPSTILDQAVELSHLCYPGFRSHYRAPQRFPNLSLASRFAEARSGIERYFDAYVHGRKPLNREELSRLRLEKAQELLDVYGRARLVITTRLHCYLPCLAFGTPALLLLPDKTFDPSRFTFGEPYLRAYRRHELSRLDWSPSVPDISPHRIFLEQLCRRAVEIQDNPLKHESIGRYYRESGWSGHQPPGH